MSTTDQTGPNGTLPEPRRYALVVVLEAQNPRGAWELLASAVGLTPAQGESNFVYVGAPWEGIPFYAEDLCTERLTLGMSLIDGPSRTVSVKAELSPCD